ncbi:hypothetical protein TNCV_3892311 [Trichonephila clavipes]|nr:hypothetical protein TNCV_3892311 [Trichonephila clavipes]
MLWNFEVVKVTKSWSACHEFEPGAAKDPPCRGVDARYSVEAQTSTHSENGKCVLGFCEKQYFEEMDCATENDVSKNQSSADSTIRLPNTSIEFKCCRYN